MELSVEDKCFLFKIVRDMLYFKLTDSESPSYYKSKDIYKKNIGVFIKIMVKDKLRAYGGVLEPEKGLLETVQDLTLNACFYDPRFMPLKADELENISIQFAIVDSMSEIHDTKLIKPEIHGLLIESGAKRGVMLPWDMEEIQIDPEQYVNEAALKAGIEDVSKAKLKIFKVITFNEKTFKSAP